MLPLAASVAIHVLLVTLVLALMRTDRIAERPRSTRAMVLLAPPPAVMPVIQAVAQQPPSAVTIPPRPFDAPGGGTLTAPAQVPALQMALLEVPRPLLLPAAEIARLPAAPAPPLRIDNLAPLAARAMVPAASAVLVSRPSGFEPAALARSAAEIPARRWTPPLAGGGFEDATLIPAGQPQRTLAPAPPVTRSLEILLKPRPAYTEEARRQRIEGEVVLDILFAASGQVRVLGTVRGLGHGLDENAIAAAEAIRFRPAERAGLPADSTAIVHIVFELAY
jgi:TonB family protein